MRIFLVLSKVMHTNLEKFLRWIKACRRLHDQLNAQRINKHRTVCSKHFIEGNGPTLQYPDPTPADSSILRPARPVRKRSLSLSENQTVIKEDNCEYNGCRRQCTGRGR
ncbi:uncharacterized protein LOC130047278 [Ostrea edulis]|uniref:uncharacterized protein LOC130047278 n=1 Tax=Ostrea edulis TaxID=37623 RepID=UPI0024AF4C5F|nr:uncharacterized protein LOC130047278 [Ostrea edulis]